MKFLRFVVIILLSVQFFNVLAQTQVWFQGFEGASLCTENWTYTGGEVTTRTAKTGVRSLMIGRGTGGANACPSGLGSTMVVFDAIDVSGLAGMVLEVSHRLLAVGGLLSVQCGSGSGEGLDTREGAVIQVEYNLSGSWITIGRMGGNNNYTYSWTTLIGGTTNTCAQLFSMPNPLTHNIPNGTNTLRLRAISVRNTDCLIYSNQMNAANPPASNYDRWDEGFYIDNVRLTTTSTIIPSIWTGEADNRWSNCLNWHNKRVPNASSHAIIPDNALDNCHVRVDNGICFLLTMNSATDNTPDLHVRDGRTLNVLTDVVVNKTAGSGDLEIDVYEAATMNVTGNVTINRTAGSGHARLRLIDTGAAGIFVCNNLTLNGSTSGGEEAELKHNLNTSAQVIVNGNLTINTGGTVDMSGVPTSLRLRGNWINMGLETDFKETGSTIILDGTGNQQLTTNAFNEVFFNLIINKPSGSFTLNNPLEMVGNVNFTSGIVFSATTSLLILRNLATVSNVSNASFVNGPVRKIGNSAFTFPIGKNGWYRPAAISAPVNTGHHFTAEYFMQSPWPLYFGGSMGPGINNVSSCEYWIINQTNGTSNVFISLSWNSYNPTPCSGVVDPSSLLVGRWNGTLWNSHGNGGTTGNATAGTIVSNEVLTSYGPFTLVSSSAINPLPVEWLEFTAKAQEGEVLLKWSTASEINSSHFEIERSVNGVDFQQLGIIQAAGMSSTISSYDFVDAQTVSGINYYRLKQVDWNGDFEYSVIRTAFFEKNEISIFYSSIENQFHIECSNLSDVHLFNLSGQSISTRFIGEQTFQTVQSLIPGIYIVQFSCAGQLQSAKVGIW